MCHDKCRNPPRVRYIRTGPLALLALVFAACSRPTTTPNAAQRATESAGSTATTLAARLTVETPIPSQTTNETPSATTSPTPTQRAQANLSARPSLVVDSAAGLLFGTEPGVIRVYSTSSGLLTTSLPLEPDEFLIGADSSRLFVVNPDWRMRALDRDGGELYRVALPTPLRDDPAFAGTAFPVYPALPLIDGPRGRVLAFSGSHVTVLDATTDNVSRQFDVPPAGAKGSIVRASLDQSGTTLYLARSDPGLVDWEGSPGVRLMAVDLEDMRIIDETELVAQLTGWIPTEDGVIAWGWTYKLLGTDQRVWKKGLEVSRRTESDLEWSVYDPSRKRIVGDVVYEAGGPLHTRVADSTTLDLKFFAEPIGLPPGVQGARLSAYDPATDRLFAQSSDTPRLIVIAASALEPQPSTAPHRVYDVVASGYLTGPADADATPALVLGAYYPTPEGGGPTPTADWNPDMALSEDAGRTWHSIESVGLHRVWPTGVKAGRRADGGLDLFGIAYGIFRSSDLGRTWTPASDGLGALSVRELIVSPDYAADRTVIAFTETTYGGPGTWRSRDFGASWEPITELTTGAFSPNYSLDRRLMGFGRPLLVSVDAGETWSRRGSLPPGSLAGRLWVIPASAGRPEILLALATEHSWMGGGAHWPESGAHVYRSTDSGATWEPVWGSSEASALDGSLIGPVLAARSAAGQGTSVRPDRLPVWVLQLDSVTLMSEDAGMTWLEVLPRFSSYHAVVGSTAFGTLLVIADHPPGIDTLSLALFEPVTTPAPKDGR